ncbi:HAMP domain-containing histidine kinase [Vibrio sp. JC009]|uniref:sensor histidine kinase n=1 Tax=Vibrio sp. JC009 TaxID=2912314 RepID=UPI0023AF328F|nr:ATP-binding protein [Vibrio sp. JC009]WED20776.1 HAMP domain-containing histidine kinase [Vibrio sp. JC009]
MRFKIAFAFMSFVLTIIAVLGISLGSVLLLKIDSLIKHDRQALIYQQMQGIADDISSYFYLRHLVLKDYAAFPVLLQGVMQPSAGLANTSDFIDDLSLFGEYVPLHLFDISGDLVYTTNPASACLVKPGLVQKLITESSVPGVTVEACHNKYDNTVNWMMVTPIMYHDMAEGYLVAELDNNVMVSDIGLTKFLYEHRIEVLKGEESIFAMGKQLQTEPREVHIPLLGFVLKYRSDGAQVAEARMEVIYNFALILLMIMLAVILITRLLGYTYLVRPLQNLREQAQKVAEGEHHDEHINDERIEEIQELSEHFEQMAGKVERREQALKSANQSLQTLNEKTLQQQQLLVQSEKLASVGQLAAGVAHEINNPTAYIKSNLEQLGCYAHAMEQFAAEYRKLEGQLRDAGMAEYLEEIDKIRSQYDLKTVVEDIVDISDDSIKGIQKIQDIVNDLRSFSRVDDQDMQEVNINKDVVEPALRLVTNELSYKCKIKKTLEELPMVQCRAGEIGQVVMNLLLNAMEAIDKTGVIKVSSYLSDGFVCLDVTDNGRGIDEHIMLKLFDPFYTTKPVGKGPGLGLAVSQAILKKHGGKISVQSDPGKGTTFTVSLPVAEAKS